MAAVNIYEAKTHLSRLLRRVRAGEEIVIADNGTPVAKLVPVGAPDAPRVLGTDRGQIWIAPGALDPMSDAELATWYDAPLVAAPPTKTRKKAEPKTTATSQSKRRSAAKARRK